MNLIRASALRKFGINTSGGVFLSAVSSSDRPQ